MPLYGSFKVWGKKRGTLSETIIGIGQTLGEEVLCDGTYLHRTENCYALSESNALLCIEKFKWLQIRETVISKGVLSQDVNILDEIFRINYF